MPLKLVKRPESGIWRVRGTVQGRRVDQSARTRDRRQARQYANALEKEIFAQTLFDKHPKPERGYSFGDAALSYLESGRGSAYDITRVLDVMGNPDLNDITQGYIDKAAIREWPDATNSTRLRLFYVPVGAILDYAHGERMMLPFKIKRPRPEKTRTDWLTPAEAEAVISAARGMAPLLTFMFGTGVRGVEACSLTWKDISPDNQRVTLWITKTTSRSFSLCARTRAALPPRRGRNDPVFLRDDGRPWSRTETGRYFGPARKLRRILKQNPNLPKMTLHACRHSWASWAYADHQSTMHLMSDGGWRSLSLVQRYTHLGTQDLLDEVKAFGWRDFGQYLGKIHA